MSESIKCMVKDCENHKHEGGFVGDLCKPCHQFITTGEGIYSQVYRNAHPAELTDAELYKEAVFFADYCMNHFDRHSKADMSILYSQLTDKFKAILRKARGNETFT